MMDQAQDLDESTPAISPTRLRAIVREARKHGCNARIVGLHGASTRHVPHVLVIANDGSILATRSAVRLALFLGY